jgi:hypothetical protein
VSTTTQEGALRRVLTELPSRRVAAWVLSQVLPVKGQHAAGRDPRPPGAHYVERGVVSLMVLTALTMPAVPVTGAAASDPVAPSGPQILSPASQQLAAVAEDISPPSGDANEAQVAIDGKGNALVVWGRSDGFHGRIQLRRRFASGSLSPVQTLSPAHRGASQPQVALDGNGNALVVWTLWNGNNHVVQLRRRSASGTLGPVQTLSGLGIDAYGPQVAIDLHGNAVVVWTGAEQAGPYRIQLRRRSASGTLGSIGTLSPGGAAYPQLAMDVNGNALVVWTHYDGTYDRIQLRRHSTAGSLSAVQTLSPAGGDASGPQVAIDRNRNAVVVWSGVRGIQLRSRSAAGGLSAVQTLSAAGGDLPQVAINGNGAALVAWQGYDGATPRIGLRRRSATGGLNAVQMLSPAGLEAYRPQLAIDAANNALVVWQLFDATGLASIQLRRRTALGHLGVVQTLSKPGPRASDPPVVIDARRSALAVWSHYDGTTWRIQAARADL